MQNFAIPGVLLYPTKESGLPKFGRPLIGI